MKKNLLTIVMSMVALTCMTGCTKEKTLPIIEELPTTTKKVEIDKLEQPNQEVMEETSTLSYTAYVASNKNLGIMLYNTSEKTNDVIVTVNYLSGDGKTVGIATETVNALEPKREAAIVLANDTDWDTFDISVKESESKNTSLSKNIKYTHKNTGRNIELTIKNETDKTINTLSFSVAYFDKNHDLVGFTTSSDLTIEGKSDGTIKLDYPRNERNRKITFDTYEVYLNQAY